MRLWGLRVHHKVIADVCVLQKHRLGIWDIRKSCHKQHRYYLLLAEFQKSEQHAREVELKEMMS